MITGTPGYIRDVRLKILSSLNDTLAERIMMVIEVSGLLNCLSL